MVAPWYRPLVATLSVLLMAYVVTRSQLLSFTYDEVVSTAFTRSFNWSGLSSDANVHLLNVVLTSGIMELGGSSEMALRLPNTIAFVLYLWAAVDLSRDLRRDLALLQFVLLSLCPFVLDFFSLSRGYGLGLGLMLSSMACALRFFSSRRSVWAALSILSGMAGVLASYPMLNFFLPMALLLSIKMGSGIPGRPAAWGRSGVLLAPVGLFVYVLLPVLIELRAGRHLYFGGQEGFWSDTVGSLGRCIGYHAWYSGLVAVVFKLLFAGAILVASRTVYLAIRTRDLDRGGFFSALLLMAVLMPIVQHRVLGTNFPVERTAILYYPLIVLMLPQALGGIRRSAVLLPGLSLGMGSVLHFLATMNFDHAYSWRYDSGSREAVEYVLGSRAGPTRLGIDFFNAPSIRYYQEACGSPDLEVTVITGAWEYRPGIEELDPAYYEHAEVVPEFDSVAMAALLKDKLDVYYLDRYYTDEMDRLGVRYQVLKSFPGSRTKLITVVRY